MPRVPTWQGEVRAQVQVSVGDSDIRIEGYLSRGVVEYGVPVGWPGTGGDCHRTWAQPSAGARAQVPN